MTLPADGASFASVALASELAAGLDPLLEFRPFTWFHAATAGTLLLCSLAVALLGRRWRSTPAEVALGAFWGGVIIARQGIEVAWYLLPHNFSWERSLPLQYCDLAPWIAAVALLTRRRWARAMLYYWGIALCTQAYITPTLEEGLGQTRYWWFWLGHTHIVAAAIYDLIARGYRPTWSDFRTVSWITFAYAMTLVTFNAFTRMNYGYLGPTDPARPTIIDFLGPYPLRILSLFAVVLTAFWVLTIVWKPGRSRPSPADSTPPSFPASPNAD